jgi:Holliday junction resolvase RusA-like endonuclease
VKSFLLEVPGEPKPQSRPRSRAIQKNGKWIGTTYQPNGPDMDYRSRIATMAAQEMHGAAPWDCPMLVSIVLYVIKPKSKPKWKIWADVKPDVDNYVKAILDALQGIVFFNDSQVCALVVSKRYAVDRGATTQIMVSELLEKPSQDKRSDARPHKNQS